MVADQVVPGCGDECDQSGDEIKRREQQGGSAVAERLLETDLYLPVVTPGEAIEADGLFYT